MNVIELRNLVDSLNVDKEEYMVLSSGGLVLRGLIDEAHDLDLAVTSKGLDELRKQFDVKEKEKKGWYIVSDLIECVLDDTKENREKLDDIYVEDIFHYLSFIKSSSREKDKKRIPLVEEYIRKNY